MEFFQSIKILLFGVIKRVYVWLPAIFLDPFDINKKLVQPMLPETLKFDLPWSSDWASVVLTGLIIWAVFVTFHEHRSRVSKPKANWSETDILRYLLVDSKLLLWKRANDRLVEQIELALRDAAISEHISTWGRPRNKGDEPGLPSETPIPPDNWVHDRFSILHGVSTIKGRRYKKTEFYGSNNYLEVRFNKGEILKMWPKTNTLLRVFDFRAFMRKKIINGKRVR